MLSPQGTTHGVCDILEGKGSATGKGDQALSKGLHMPEAVIDLTDLTSSDAVTLVAMIANAEGFEP